jgi:nicotinamidase-related amidase
MTQSTDAIPRVAPTELAAMIAPASTALVVIDIQHDFAAPDGAMGLLGLDLGAVPATLERIHATIAAARAAGATLAFARVVTTPAADSRALRLLTQRKGYPADALAVCRDGTPGVDYYQVSPRPGDIEVAKRLYSAFAGTGFEADLRARGIDTLVVVGLTTDCCVDATVRDAFHRDFNVFVVADACDAYDPAVHASSLAALQAHCALVTDTDAVRAAWSPR